jgi:hypothetical protein
MFQYVSLYNSPFQFGFDFSNTLSREPPVHNLYHKNEPGCFHPGNPRHSPRQVDGLVSVNVDKVLANGFLPFQ